MAIDIYSIDQLYPTFTGNETNAEKIAMIMDYLYQLIESLKYTLYHLDEGNFSGGMSEYVTGKAMDEELKDYAKEEELADYVTDGELATELQPYAKTSDLSVYAQRSELNSYVPRYENGTISIEAFSDSMDVNLGKIVLTSSKVTDINAATVFITAPGGLYVNGQRIA